VPKSVEPWIIGVAIAGGLLLLFLLIVLLWWVSRGDNSFFFFFFVIFHFYRQYDTFTQQDIAHTLLAFFPRGDNSIGAFKFAQIV
jgi:hypothetical protein